MKDQPVIYTYRGEDRFYGVPRRSLTQQDFDRLTPTQRADVIASSSYVERKAEPSKPAASKADSSADSKEG